MQFRYESWMNLSENWMDIKIIDIYVDKYVWPVFRSTEKHKNWKERYDK